MLFSLTRRWHKLGNAENRLLASGALVHDVGRMFGEKKHAHTGAQLIMDDSWLPLGEAERRRIAYLTRYHKGKVPVLGEDDLLDRDADDVEAMRVLLGLLRAADGLDSRLLGGPNLVLTLRGRVIQIHGYVEMEESEAARVYGRRKKLALLEESLDCQIRTEWFGVETGLLVG